MLPRRFLCRPGRRLFRGRPLRAGIPTAHDDGLATSVAARFRYSTTDSPLSRRRRTLSAGNVFAAVECLRYANGSRHATRDRAETATRTIGAIMGASNPIIRKPIISADSHIMEPPSTYVDR